MKYKMILPLFVLSVCLMTGCAVLPAGLKKYDDASFNPGVNAATEDSLTKAEKAGAEELENKPQLTPNAEYENQVAEARDKTNAGVDKVNAGANQAQNSVNSQMNTYYQAAGSQKTYSDLNRSEAEYYGAMQTYQNQNNAEREKYNSSIQNLNDNSYELHEKTQNLEGLQDEVKEKQDVNLEQPQLEELISGSESLDLSQKMDEVSKSMQKGDTNPAEKPSTVKSVSATPKN